VTPNAFLSCWLAHVVFSRIHIDRCSAAAAAAGSVALSGKHFSCSSSSTPPHHLAERIVIMLIDGSQNSMGSAPARFPSTTDCNALTFTDDVRDRNNTRPSNPHACQHPVVSARR